LFVDVPELLPEIEVALIEWFNPQLNCILSPNRQISTKRSRVDRVAFPVRIERVIQINVPGIGKKIKDTRERDPRSVDELAKAANMTRANWYRIEREDNEVLPEPTLRKIEKVLGVDFGVNFDD
jgi:DNA-binding XRE family transcriptional regulator